MKNNGFKLSIAGLLVCSIFLMGTTIDYSEIDSIYGTWKNQDYEGMENKFAKIEFGDGNTWYTYSTVDSKVPAEKGTYTLVFDCKSSQAIYYKVIRKSQDGSIIYELYRFSRLIGYGTEGKVLEIQSSINGFPPKINPNSSTYSFFYRSYSGLRLLQVFGFIGLLAIGVLIVHL